MEIYQIYSFRVICMDGEDNVIYFNDITINNSTSSTVSSEVDKYGHILVPSLVSRSGHFLSIHET